MLKVKSLAVVSLMAALFSTGVSATELKVGYVNLQRIFRDAPVAQKAQKRLEGEFKERDLDLQKRAAELQKMQANLEKNSVTMGENDRRNKEQEFANLSREFQRRQREFREDFNLRTNEENAAVIERANKAIKQIADSEKYDLILQEAVYWSPRIDITDRVIKSLSDGK